MTANDSLTPKQIAQELDRHIVGQSDAKRAVAIALRNRWRRMQLDPELRDEVTSPALSFFSKTIVSFPEHESSRAMLNPITPPPITITSVIFAFVI